MSCATASQESYKYSSVFQPRKYSVSIIAFPRLVAQVKYWTHQRFCTSCTNSSLAGSYVLIGGVLPKLASEGRGSQNCSDNKSYSGYALLERPDMYSSRKCIITGRIWNSSREGIILPVKS